ncbi:hypothetical protein V1520DRAFT_329431 [Lipomyces starkeyi]
MCANFLMHTQMRMACFPADKPEFRDGLILVGLGTGIAGSENEYCAILPYLNRIYVSLSQRKHYIFVTQEACARNLVRIPGITLSDVLGQARKIFGISAQKTEVPVPA